MSSGTPLVFDAIIRRFIDPPIDRLGKIASRIGLTADGVTVGGLIVGLSVIPALASQAYAVALVLVVLNRLADGLDGAIARVRGPSDRGGYLDIVCDFLFYGAVPMGFALADPAQNALPAVFLLFAFVGTGSSFLTFAILAAKRGITTEARGKKSIFYLGGLTEGAETIGLFLLVCLFPDAFPIAAWIFGGLCWVTTLTRMREAWNAFTD